MLMGDGLLTNSPYITQAKEKFDQYPLPISPTIPMPTDWHVMPTDWDDYTLDTKLLNNICYKIPAYPELRNRIYAVCDASFADDRLTRKSQRGHLISITVDLLSGRVTDNER
jgi:hypothetical protein